MVDKARPKAADVRSVTHEWQMVGDQFYRLDGDIVPSPEKIEKESEAIRDESPESREWECRHYVKDVLNTNHSMLCAMIQAALEDIRLLWSACYKGDELDASTFCTCILSLCWLLEDDADACKSISLTIEELCAHENIEPRYVRNNIRESIRKQLSNRDFASWLMARIGTRPEFTCYRDIVRRNSALAESGVEAVHLRHRTVALSTNKLGRTRRRRHRLPGTVECLDVAPVYREQAGGPAEPSPLCLRGVPDAPSEGSLGSTPPEYLLQPGEGSRSTLPPGIWSDD